jgi:hypothetical protein
MEHFCLDSDVCIQGYILYFFKAKVIIRMSVPSLKSPCSKSVLEQGLEIHASNWSAVNSQLENVWK